MNELTIEQVAGPSIEDYAYSKLLSYIKLEMPTYRIGKHHRLIANYLEKLERGDITRLAIFMPPRHGKTLLASEFFSSWYLGRNPEREIIFASYAQDRSDDVGKAVRDRMRSEKFKSVFPESVLRTDSQGTRKFQTIKGGSFFATSWSGTATGRGSNCFEYNTLINTEDGPIPIGTLHSMEFPPLVLSLDQFGKLCYSSIECSQKIEERTVYEFKTRRGKTIRATADHRIYTRSRGFVKCKNLRIGEKLVYCQSDTRPDETFNSKMHAMQQPVYKSKCRSPKRNSQWTFGCVLLSKMFETRSFGKKQQTMCNLHENAGEEKWKEDWCKILFRLLQIYSSLESTVKKRMHRMWRMVLASYYAPKILQQNLCFESTFKEYAWQKQFSFQRWNELCKTIPENSKNDYGTRQQTMHSLQYKRKNNEPIELIGSPSRRKHTTQPAREFGDIMSQLPHDSTQVKCDTISMAPRICKSKISVYDIQVEETHNFFAGEILVHNCFIMDDLIKDRADSQSDVNRKKREDWFTSTAYTRLMPDDDAGDFVDDIDEEPDGELDDGRMLLIMTRWAYNDIAAFLLEQLAHENWHILNCPAIAESDDILGRLPGDALWPSRFPKSKLEKVKKAVGTDDWSSLYQQRPLPKEGGMVKLNWFSRYDHHKMRYFEDLLRDKKDIPEEFNLFYKIVISLDTAYKANELNDPSALTVWGYHKNRQYLLESVTEKLEFPQLKKWLLRYHKKYMKWNLGMVPVLIEDAASGQSLIQVLKQETNIPVIAMYPEKSKLIRMEHASDYIESGRVYLPERAVWLTDLETELAQFPYGKHDDQCDSMSQYIKWIYKPRKRKSKKKMHVK